MGRRRASLTLSNLVHSPNTDPNAPNPIPLISGPNAHVYFQRYLSVGEYIFDTASGFAARSSHFRQTDPALNLAKGADDLIGKLRDQGASKGSQWFFGGKDKAN